VVAGVYGIREDSIAQSPGVHVVSSRLRVMTVNLENRGCEMNLPGFTAKASLYRSNHYRLVADFVGNNNRRAVTMQAWACIRVWVGGFLCVYIPPEEPTVFV
jgi:hypothetical protein